MVIPAESCTRVKVVVLPVFKRQWLFYAWSEGGPDVHTDLHTDWKAGKGIPEKAQLLMRQCSAKATLTAQDQWEKLKAADPKSFRGTIHKLAKWALSKEDPLEPFFRAVPHDMRSLEIIHPASLDANLVRRRLRMLAFTREQHHNRQILGWSLATLPQLPLMLSPFPNVTLYYTVYKLWSNRNAAVGCSALKSAFKRLDEVQRILEEEERTDALKRKSRGLLGRWRLRASGAAPIMVDGPVPVFTASKELDRVVKPLERWETPLSDSVAQALQKLYRQGPGMGDLLERARHRIEEGATGHHTDHGKSLCRKR